MHWNNEEINYLKENYHKNIRKEDISKKLGKTVKAIERKAENMGLSRPRFPSNKPSKRTPQKIIDKRYYEKNKDKVYQRKMNRRKMLKKELVSILGGKCKKCGYNKCDAALDFHHNKKNKDACMNTLLKNKSKKKLLKEAKKCILLCANCHRELHFMGL